jgi:hypothetical protein
MSLACEKPVHYLKKGQPAKCTGYLFSPEQERKVYQYNEERKILLMIVEKQELHVNTLDQQLENMRKHNDYVSKRLRQEKERKFWNYTLYFGVGALLTGVIAANVR